MGNVEFTIGAAANTSGIVATTGALAELSAAFASAATAASAASAQLSAASGSFGNLSTMLGHAATSTVNLGGSINTLGETIRQQTGFGGVLTNFREWVGGLAPMMENAAETGVGVLTGAFSKLGSAVSGFVGQAGMMFTALVGFQGFSDAISMVSRLKNEMLSLNETQQSQNVGWAYLFGGAGGPNYQASSQMLGWTAKESYNMPFTRQDMNAAISTLQTLGLSPEAVQHYLPILADLAVRNPGMSLERIAMSVMGAQFGLTRMLRYDLRITPEQLQQYGLDFAEGRHIDPKTLLPALENFARAQGYYEPTDKGDMGASWMLAHNTFQGAMTSWQDRYQNFLLQLGGTYWEDQDVAGGVDVRNLLAGTPGHKGESDYIHKMTAAAGDVRRGSIFDMMITGLRGVTDWWDHNQEGMNKMADLFGNLMGQGLKNAGNAVVGFADGLRQSGLGDQVTSGVQNLLKWLGDPENQAHIKDLAKTIGEDLGKVIQHAETDFGNLKSIFDSVTKSIGDLNKASGNLGGGFFDLLGKGFHELEQELATSAKAWQHFASAMDAFSKHDWGRMWSELGAWLQDAASVATVGLIPASGSDAGGTNKTVPKGSSPPPAGTGNAPGGSHGAGQAAIIGGPGWTGGGSSTSWGDTNTNVYVFGADSRAVQGIVDQAAEAQGTATLLAARSIGVGRFRAYGLY